MKRLASFIPKWAPVAAIYKELHKENFTIFSSLYIILYDRGGACDKLAKD